MNFSSPLCFLAGFLCLFVAILHHSNLDVNTSCLLYERHVLQWNLRSYYTASNLLQLKLTQSRLLQGEPQTRFLVREYRIVNLKFLELVLERLREVGLQCLWEERPCFLCMTNGLDHSRV